MIRHACLAALLLLGACHPSAPEGDETADNAAPATTPLRPASPSPERAAGRWESRDGALSYRDDSDTREKMVIDCAKGRLAVILPGVAPISSEERLSFGGGGDIEVLVVDPRAVGTDVRGEAEALPPERLLAMLKAGPGASYGATALGPLVPVPDTLASALATRCAG